MGSCPDTDIYPFILWCLCSHQFKTSTTPSPCLTGNPQAFEVVISALGWRIQTLPGCVKSFQQNTSVISLNMEVFKENGSLLQANGSGEKLYKVKVFKAWLMCRWSWLLILAFTHKKKRLGKAKH